MINQTKKKAWVFLGLLLFSFLGYVSLAYSLTGNFHVGVTYHLPQYVRVHIGDIWIYPNTSDMAISRFYVNRWLNYSVTDGNQYVYDAKPDYVYFDDVLQTEEDTWSHNGTTLQVNTTSSINVAVQYALAPTPSPSPTPIPTPSPTATPTATPLPIPTVNPPYGTVFVSGSNFQTVIGSGGAFAITYNTKNVTFAVLSGLLNGSNCDVYAGLTGRYRFTSENTSSLQVWYNENVTSMRLNGQTPLENGYTLAVVNGVTYTLEWDTITQPVLPILFILGVFGFIMMVFGPCWLIVLVRRGSYAEALWQGAIIFAVGFAFAVGWLWQ